jgi:chromosomal replication initiator protein
MKIRRRNKRIRPMFKPRVDKDIVINEVCSYFKIPFEQVNTRSRERPLPEIRFIIMNFLYKYSLPSLKQVGEVFNRDHTTVLNAIVTLRDLCETEPETKSMIMEIGRRILVKNSA